MEKNRVPGNKQLPKPPCFWGLTLHLFCHLATQEVDGPPWYQVRCANSPKMCREVWEMEKKKMSKKFDPPPHPQEADVTLHQTDIARLSPRQHSEADF